MQESPIKAPQTAPEAPQTALQLLQEVSCVSKSKSNKTKTPSAQEIILAEEKHVRSVIRSNDHIDAAVANWKLHLERTITTQMVNNHCTHVVYYTINRVLYILYHDEEGVPAPVRSFGCPSADSNEEAVDKDNILVAPVDYVQYISWLLKVHEGRTANWQALSEELHRQHVEKRDKDKDTSNTTMIRMALMFPFPVFGGISINVEELFYKDFPVHSSRITPTILRHLDAVMKEVDNLIAAVQHPIAEDLMQENSCGTHWYAIFGHDRNNWRASCSLGEVSTKLTMAVI
ncbi:hypothetical protein K435DRAFT_875136 [Dendrothele bispora CBS 962.96]|uniref:Uncharacterized protein n=1 Tax=Dendrothele bispora (strain CBS 962.96) TaxID=1314807 RepID=A0A4S8KUX7_DENBC|nr:hypothetical protein K435DRAFT_875136 [Dendrothele bispora CBS 962.96]